LPEAVFIGDAGNVWMRAIEGHPPTFRVPRYQRVAFVTDADDLCAKPTFSVDDYIRRGRLSDGRYVYCAPSFDVKECAYRLVVSEREAAHADDLIRRELWSFIERTYPEAIFLQESVGPDPVEPWELEHLQSQNLRKRLGLAFVAVKVAHA
jgi:hypothetical protein